MFLTNRRKWKRVLLVPLLITTIWLASWAGLLVSETRGMVDTRQNLDREPGQHIIARLLEFDGIKKTLDVGWTPVWCRATNDCEPFRAETENFTVGDSFNIPMKPGRHALYATKLLIRNDDNPDPSVFNPWIKWGFSYPFDSGVALIDFPMSENKTQDIKGVVLSGFLMNVRIGLDVEWGDFCLARETSPCDTLRINFKLSRWRTVKVVVVIVALVNWIVTIAVCTMAIMVIYHLLNRQRIISVRHSEPLSVLAAQFGAIFTIPGLRAILPDAPSSACVFDLVAIIPNLFIITFTGSTLLVVLSVRKLRGSQQAGFEGPEEKRGDNETKAVQTGTSQVDS